MQMQQYIEELEAEAAEKFEEHLKDVAESTYTDTAKTVEESAPDMSVRFDFDKINPDIVDEVVNKPWATDGKGFSDRLGYDKERLVEELNKAVAQGLLRGQSSEEIAAGLVKQLGISQRNAIRIVRTETAAIASKADMKLYKDLGIDSIKFMASLDGKTCAVCSDMDGKVIPLKQCRIGLNMPPLHPNCRCYTVPVIDDDFAELLEGDERTARDEDGNYIRIPANIDYNGWKTKMVKKAPGNKENNSRRLSKPLEFYYNGSERFIPANAEIEHIKVIAGNGSDFEFRLAQSFAEEYPEGGTAADWSKCVGKVTSDQFEFDIHWIEDKNGKMYVPKIAGKKTMTIRYLGKSFFYGLTDGKTYEAEDARDGFYRVIDDSGEGYLYSKEKPGPLDNPDIRGRWEIVEK